MVSSHNRKQSSPIGLSRGGLTVKGANNFKMNDWLDVKIKHPYLFFLYNIIFVW